MDKTPLGLTRLDPGESLSIDGFSFQALNPRIIDTLLSVGAFSHVHDGHPKLGNPVDEPEIIADATTGLIPADTTVGVCYTVVDEYGGESLPSPQVSVTTPEGIPPPYDFPEYEVVHDQGNLRHGTFYYVLTLTDDSGGETEASPTIVIEVPAGPAQNAIVFTGFDEIVTGAEGATGWRLYKSTGNNRFHYLADGPVGVDQVTDDGLLCADCLVQPPSVGKTNATNRVIVTIPANGEIEAATAVRIYLGVGGDFTSPSLAAELAPADVVDPIYFDALNLDTGQPPDASTTVQGANPINPDTDIMDWPWKAPVATSDDLPDGEPGDARFVMDTATIWLLGADETWTQMSAPPQYWKQPVPTEALLPSSGNETGDVRAVLEDRSLWIWNEQLPGTWEKLSPKFNTVQDQGVDVPQRLKYNFTGAGVTVTDDETNDATVIDITGGGGSGGGGGGPFAIEDNEGIDYTLADEPHIRLVGDIRLIYLPDEPNLGVDAEWVEAPSNSWAIVGGKLKPQASGVGSNPARAQRQSGGSMTPRNIGLGYSMEIEYTILTGNWEYIGLRIYNGNLSTAPLDVKVHRLSGMLELLWNHGSLASAADPDYTAPVIGETRRLHLTVEYDGPGYPYYASGVEFDEGGSYMGGVSGEVPWNDQAAAPITSVLGHWTNADAYEISDYRTNWSALRRFFAMRTDINDPGWEGQFSFMGDDGLVGLSPGRSLDPGVDWIMAEPFYYDACTETTTIAGKLVSDAAAAPAPGDVIASSYDIRPPKDMLLQCLTGDDDGLEFGAITLTMGGQLIWEMGRSTDPATKHPFVVLDGLSFPSVRPYQN